MSADIPLLSNLKVAAPCHAPWQEMEAVDGDRVHFCAGCKKNVYNLSAITQTQAEGLLRKHEGDLCVRYYQRTDGTILTQNCPVGQAALRMQMIARSKRAALATVAMAAIIALGDMRFVAPHSEMMGETVNVRPSVFQQFEQELELHREIVSSQAVEPTPQVERGPSMGEVKKTAEAILKLPSGLPQSNQGKNKGSDSTSPK